MTLTVRAALPEDFESVARLLADLGRPAVLGGDDERGHRTRYAAWLAAPDLEVFVAEEDGEVVGIIDLELLPRLNFPGPMAWVPDLIVSERHRGRRVGAALLARAEEAARAAGAFALALESAHWRTGAHAFYLREGMSDSAKSFVKVLRTDLGWPPKAPEEERPSLMGRPRARVRPGMEADLETVNEIYNHYVLASHATFDLEPTTIAWRRDWFGHYDERGPFRIFVAEADEGVIGYASSSRYRLRPGYQTSVETSAYVAPEAVGRGIGAALYGALFHALEAEDLHRAYAGIALPNPASVRLHQRFGFREAGRFSEQGRKFDRYWDVAWFEKQL
jgi:phosphinothricin acetyltransferase